MTSIQQLAQGTRLPTPSRPAKLSRNFGSRGAILPCISPPSFHLRGASRSPAVLTCSALAAPLSNEAAHAAAPSELTAALTAALPAGVAPPTAETAATLLALFEEAGLPSMCGAAAALRDAAFPGAISFSPKVFIPLTRLCRDSCGYCTFAQPPRPGQRAFMTLTEVLEVATLGAAQGCCEALFTLGDKPEDLYPEAAEELRDMGFDSTIAYVEAAAAAVLQAGLIPHVNAGVMTAPDIARLKRVSASQGLMLESSAASLLQPGGPHHDCPDKQPAARLTTIEAAGAASVPFTSGILIGIGETRLDRLRDLLELRRLHLRHGHIQEIIVQNFRRKAGTAMADAPEPSLEELQWSISAARLVFWECDVSVQAPPNLTPAEGTSPEALQAGWSALLQAGINDWGGVSPVTRDWVNPERSWPHVQALAQAAAAAGKVLLPRLPVYPRFLRQGAAMGGGSWLHKAAGGPDSIAAAVARASDAEGLLRGSDWAAGAQEALDTAGGSAGEEAAAARARGASPPIAVPSDKAPAVPRPAGHKWTLRMGADGIIEGCPPPAASPSVQALLVRVLQGGGELTAPEIERLFAARGDEFRLVCAAADELRRAVNDDYVSYVVNRNINYTNVCSYGCNFCAFSQGSPSKEPAYTVPLPEITRRTAEAWDRGATEVCMQGGIHPSFTGDTYLRILEAVKAGAPDIHVHAFSPLEVQQGAASKGISVPEFLAELRSAGLGSLPGTAAEVLHPDVRSLLCPDKLTGDEWLGVLSAAHEAGLPTTSTIMFGHCDTPAAWAHHLVAVREVQVKTGGISEFVPLPFVHMEAPLYLRGGARRGPTLRECTLMHAVARLALHPWVSNIQASWVKMGPHRAAALLQSGCNDMGGSIMNESITRAAGAAHGQELPPVQMEAIIRAAGRTPLQRTTLYGDPPSSQVMASYEGGQVALEQLVTAAGGDAL